MPYILVSLVFCAGLAAMPWLLFNCLRQLFLRRLEEQILWQKYGDLPMFKAFFVKEMGDKRNDNDSRSRHYSS